jgi:hypothetical protein
MRAAVLIAAAVFAFVPAGQVRAQPVSIPAPAAKPSKQVCVNAELNGEVALSYDCLSQQLAPTRTA